MKILTQPECAQSGTLVKAARLLLATLFLFGIDTSTAAAHHSTAAYDYSKKLALNGTVKEFLWTNPHMFIRILGTGKDGRTTEYNIECGTPNINARHGWSQNDLKPGDKVAIEYSPMRNGEPAGTLISVKLSDGRVLYGPAVDIRSQAPPAGALPNGAPNQ